MAIRLHREQLKKVSNTYNLKNGSHPNQIGGQETQNEKQRQRNIAENIEADNEKTR